MKAASSSVSLLGSESEKASGTSSGMSCTVIPDLQNVQRLHCWADILAISLHMSPQRQIPSMLSAICQKMLYTHTVQWYVHSMSHAGRYACLSATEA